MYKEYLLEVINKFPIVSENVPLSKSIRLREKIEKMSEEDSGNFLKLIIKEQSIGPAASITAGVATGNPAFAALIPMYRILKSQRDNCVRACGEFSITGGQKRQLCMAKCHYQVAMNEVQQIKAMYGNCNNNPGCIQVIQQKLTEANQRLAQAQAQMMDFQMKMQRSGMSQKDLNRQVDPTSKHLIFRKGGDKSK